MFSNFFPSEVVVFASDRSSDYTLPPDVTILPEQQRELLQTESGLNPAKIVAIRQVHGDRILVGEEQSENIEEADGIITNQPDIALTIRTADCAPVFIYDPVNRAIGLTHAGWKGSEINITGKTVKAMADQYGSRGEDLLAAVGPAIQSCCNEVGEEFKNKFPKETVERDGHLYLELPKANQNQLLDAGVREENIFISSQCTCCGVEYHSYRRDDDKSGRMISVMMLKE